MAKKIPRMGVCFVAYAGVFNGLFIPVIQHVASFYGVIYWAFACFIRRIDA